MRTYRRYYELRDKANKKLCGSGVYSNRLLSSVIEISMMDKDDAPESKWFIVEEILEMCKTHSPVGEEGRFKASINQMDPQALERLRSLIELL